MTTTQVLVDGNANEERHELIFNRPAPGIPYFTSSQLPPAGTASDGQQTPKLFQKLKIRGMEMQNRIMLSPLCQYSAEDGHLTDWHMAHLGGIISRGPGFSLVEATAITPEGRITPEDSGLWKDSQIEPLRKIVQFAHSQGQKIGIQLGHAGRKASTVAPWLSAGAVALKEANGWPDNVVGPSAVRWSETHAPTRELTLEEIEELKIAFVASVKRALTAGFDAIEIHNAHGYLFHEFLSPVANKRTDKYGGSFEGRTRLTLELVEAVRKVIPPDMPLLLRISGSDYLEQSDIKESWTLEDTVRLAPLLAERGVDLLDVSGGGQHPSQKPPSSGPGYQAYSAKAVKEAVGDKLLVGTVGKVNDATLAEQLLQDGLDVVAIGRGFQKNPGLVWTFAEELGVEINVANQIRWGFGGRPGNKPAKI